MKTLLHLTYFKSNSVRILHIFLTCWHSDATSRRQRRAFRTFLFDSTALVSSSLLSLKHAVHTFDSFTTIVNTLWTNTLAAGVMEPAVLGCPHGLTGDFTLMYGHAVIKINHSTHVFFVTGIRCVNIIAGNRHVLVVWLVYSL